MQNASLHCGSEGGKTWMVGKDVLKDTESNQLVWEITVFTSR